MPSTPFKGFALIDCNNFFVSCERVFSPAFENKPALVLSNNDGCVIARCKVTKALGIPMGAPLFQIRDLIEKHQIKMFSPNFALYSDMSNRVMQIIADFSDQMQVYSIDEAFVPIEFFSEADFENLRQKIKKWTGISVSIGIAHTKTLAKFANYLAKKKAAGIFSLMQMSDFDLDHLLSHTAVEEIWGIGRKSAQKLKMYQVATALEFKKKEQEWIKSKLHTPGLKVHLELNKVSCHQMDIYEESQKSLSYSNSFGHTINNLEGLVQTLTHYTSQAAAKLRKQSLCAQMIAVYLKSDLGVLQKSASLKFSTNSTPTLVEVTLALLKQIFVPANYKKAGISFWQLENTNQQQLDFRSPPKSECDKLMVTLDQINDKFGSGSLFYASEGFSRPWKSKREHLSPISNFEIEQVLKIKI